MDMLEEIKAMVTRRSLGEIKLNTKETEVITFKAGSTLDETRLVADTIKKRFVLKTEAEPAVPNALLHEIIAKFPDSADPTLTLQKQTYENDLYKAEMKHVDPPWTVSELIDSIAVDLACAPPAKELATEASVVDKKPAELGPTYRCANCGATGDHLTQYCPVKCVYCSFSFCAGARHMLCVVVCDIQPSQRSGDITNYLLRQATSGHGAAPSQEARCG